MGQISYSTYKLSDREVLERFIEIAKELGVPSANGLNIRVAGVNNQFAPQLNKLFEHEYIKSTLSTDAYMLSNIELAITNFPHAPVIGLSRTEGTDSISVNLKDSTQQDLAIQINLSLSRHFRQYDKAKQLESFLGKDVADFYQSRDRELDRLQQFTESLIRQNAEFGHKLQVEAEERKKILQAQLDADRKKLLDEIALKEKGLKDHEEELKKLKQEIDDSNTRDARRKIRVDLKSELKSRGVTFGLTKGTESKRTLVHALFGTLLGVTAAALGASLYLLVAQPSSIESIGYLVRFSLSAITFMASTVFYIRWNDQWFRQHADEEFRLKRLELDIDRASWVVETVLEWKEIAKDSEIPPELIERLTRNLFADSYSPDIARHPYEDLAALIGASAAVNVKTPFGDLSLDRKSIKQFGKISEEMKEEKKEEKSSE